jgi:hypothetical protein
MSDSTSRSRSVRAASGPARRRSISRATIVGSMTHSASAMRWSASASTAMSDTRSLQQVSDALGVLLDEPRGVPHLEVLRQHEHADVGMGAADAVGGHQPFVRLRRWHPDVHDRGVGVRGLDVSEQLVGILGLADDLKAGVGEQTRHTVAQERGVVGNHYAHGISTRITVPVSPSRWM